MDQASASEDNRGIRQLVLAHLDSGYDLARWLTGNVNDAENVVQQACARALQSGSAISRTEARAWFLAIVRSAFYDALPRICARAAANNGDTAIDHSPTNRDERCKQSATASSLADAVAQLPLALREVLVLRELEAMSCEQIARIAGVPLGTVMRRLSNAWALLHDLRLACDASRRETNCST